MPWYLEQCSSTLATTYSSGASSRDQNIVTVDVDYSYFNDFRRGRKPNTSNLCTRGHTGTSASAPIAAAICALALEANPKLTWRDMQYLIVLTSRYEPLSKEDGWVTNAVGRKISTKFGYGLMDAVAMVKLAKSWKTLPKQHICYSLPDTVERIIPAGHGEKLEASMNTSCKNSKNPVMFLEHVQVKITLTFHPRGNLRIILISPSGTPSDILLPRPRDKQEGSFKDWPFMSVHFWGENPDGNWKLVIVNDGNLVTNIPGKLTNWSFVFYGTEEMPFYLSRLKEPKKLLHTSKQEHAHLIRGVDQFTEFISNHCLNEKKFLITVDGEKDCTNKCPVGYYSDHKYYICRMCDKSCLSCYGPSYNNCLSCPNGFFYDNLKHQCLPCISSCETCHVSRELCETCKPGLLLYQQTCWSACPVGTYREQNVCKKCHEACESCYGPLHFNCLSCSGYFLFNGTCQPKCPSRFYANSDYKCNRCHRSCEICNDNITCIECSFTWEFDASNKCVLNSCKKGWYNQDSKSCDACYPHCQQCIGPSIQDCIYCETKYLWLEGQCVRSCPDGFFAKNGGCTPCIEMCSKCKNEKNNCIACKHDLLLYHGSCVASCPSGYFNNGRGRCEACDSTCLLCTGGSNLNCTTCPMGLYLVHNSCQIKCPDGYFSVVNEDYSECLPCHYTCKTCTDYGPTYCVSCYDNASYSNGICLPCSDGEFYNRITKECEKCDDKCSQCFGPFENTCLSCPMPLRLDEVKHTCLPCCDASLVGSECCTCSQDLGICITSDHPRSIDVNFIEYDSEEVVIPLKHIVPIVITICISVVLLFVLLFGILQAYSVGCFRFNIKGQHYELVPNHNTAKFEAEMEKISLTQDDLEDEDEIYEKV
ncbi:furin-like protease 2 [Stegodyphus dumicola]|uniref:furin-like protease 2 n=1 Tax=Stegodyphus dumicola TaxID=202533 RepID=UPI0015B29A56|nr:furin-like protease 2 [Stegodyphus dumicola]